MDKIIIQELAIRIANLEIEKAEVKAKNQALEIELQKLKDEKVGDEDGK